MADDEQVVNGWVFPAGLNVPDSQDRGWTRTQMGGDEIWIAGREILVDVAHQAGLESIETEVAAHGTGVDGVAYAAVKATVEIDGHPTASAIGSIDEPANSLEDMASTASTRAVKRAIKASLNIRSTSGTVDDPDAAQETSRTRGSGGSVRRTEGGGVEVDPPDEYDTDSDSDSDQGW